MLIIAVDHYPSVQQVAFRDLASSLGHVVPARSVGAAGPITTDHRAHQRRYRAGSRNGDTTAALGVLE